MQTCQFQASLGSKMSISLALGFCSRGTFRAKELKSSISYGSHFSYSTMSTQNILNFTQNLSNLFKSGPRPPPIFNAPLFPELDSCGFCLDSVSGARASQES